MSMRVGFIEWAGVRTVFHGQKNEIWEWSAYFWSPMAMHAQPCWPPPELDSNSLAFAMHYLCVHVGLPWACVSRLCVNDSHILSTAGADTTTMMELWMVYKWSHLWWSNWEMEIPLCNVTWDNVIMRQWYGFTFWFFLLSLCLWPMYCIRFSWVVLYGELEKSCGIPPFWNPLDQHFYIHLLCMFIKFTFTTNWEVVMQIFILLLT